MAPKPSPTPDPETPAEFSWDELPDTYAAPTTLAIQSAKVDVLAEIPEVIRKRAELSLLANTKAVAKVATSTANRPRVDYVWDCQPVPTAKVGEDFKAKIERYAKYRPADGEIPFASTSAAKGQVTARCGDPKHFRKVGDAGVVACDEKDDGAFLGVRYSVRPFEQRGNAARLPGTV